MFDLCNNGLWVFIEIIFQNIGGSGEEGGEEENENISPIQKIEEKKKEES